MAIQKTSAIALTGITLAATSGFAFAQDQAQNQNQAQPAGIYSASQLLDAEVYAQGSDSSIGEIEDVILDNSMTIESFIVETENNFGLSGKSYVVKPDQLSVETMGGDEATEPDYRIMLQADGEALSSYPVYSDAWWENTQSQAQDLWQQTKESASNAWTQIKQGTSNLIDNTQDAAGNAAEETGQAADNAADSTEQAAENAADSTAQAAENAADSTEQAAEDATN